MKVMSADRYTSHVMSGSKLQDEPTMDISGGLVILAEDGRVLYDLRLMPDGVSLDITSGSTAKVGDRIIDTALNITPYATNRIIVSRPEYKTERTTQ